MARRTDPANGGWWLLLIGLITSVALDNPLHWDADQSPNRDPARDDVRTVVVATTAGNHAHRNWNPSS